MITFSERFQFERDRYGWMLHEWYEGRSKDKQPKRHMITTYHANLEQVLSAIIDKSAGDCESIDELRGLLKAMRVTSQKASKEIAA